MRKRTEAEWVRSITVDISSLQKMLCVGRNTANEIGEAAGAAIKVGRRKLYNVAKVEAYMESLSGGNQNEDQ